MSVMELAVEKKKPVGRPAAFEVGTRQVKLPEDLVQMILWLTRLQGGTAAQIIDPLVRPVVSTKYALRYADIRRIKQAEDAAKEAAGQDPTPPLPQLNTVDPATGEMVLLEELAKRNEERAAGGPSPDPKKKPKK